MHKITAEGTQFFYFTGDEEPGDLQSTGLVVPPPDPEAIRLTLRSGKVRLVVFESMLRRGHGRVYYLVWQGSPDPCEVDRRVLDGSYADSDFADSIRSVCQHTICDRCGTVWRSLVIPPGDPYPGAPGLQDRKIASARSLHCTACGAAFRQMVLATFGGVDNGG